jgi:hypothetical protein
MPGADPTVRPAPAGDPAPAAGPTAVLITYTLVDPLVAGAFFRALRLAEELRRRGWRTVVCNQGPRVDDPKLADAMGWLRYVNLDTSRPGYDARAAREEFRGLRPDVLVMGETPFPAMRIFYEGARRVGKRLVVLDQYYRDALLPPRRGADAILLYGLATFWGEEPRLRRGYVMVPPFIAGVSSPAELPIPSRLRRRPLITFVAYEEQILRRGAALLSALDEPTAAVVSISHDPPAAGRLLREAGWDPDRIVTLPLQPDQQLFGFLQASRAALLSNGFIQIMDSLALACPVVALDRGPKAGMSTLNIDSRFEPYVSLNDDREAQCRKLNSWLQRSPFTHVQHQALLAERGGASRCADIVEALAASRPGPLAPWLRLRG